LLVFLLSRVQHGVYAETNILANGCDSCTGHQDRMKWILAPCLNRKHANVSSWQFFSLPSNYTDKKEYFIRKLQSLK